MTDPVSILDRYAQAQHSSHLTPKAKGTKSDLDVLTAAGMTGQRYPLGLSLHRLKFGADHAKRAECEAELYKQTRAHMEAQRIRGKAKYVVQGVLSWWLNDTCQPCAGRGQVEIEGTARLSGRLCHCCAGSGKREITVQPRAAAKFVARAIEDAIDNARRAMAWRVR